MAAIKQDLYLFGQMLPFLPYLFFLRRSRSRSGKTKVGECGWEQSGERRKPVVSPKVCSPTSDMSVRLHVRKSHAGALKSDSVVKKKPRLLAMYNFFGGHLISRKEKMWVKKKLHEMQKVRLDGSSRATPRERGLITRTATGNRAYGRDFIYDSYSVPIYRFLQCSLSSLYVKYLSKPIKYRENIFRGYLGSLNPQGFFLFLLQETRRLTTN